MDTSLNKINSSHSHVPHPNQGVINHKTPENLGKAEPKTFRLNEKSAVRTKKTNEYGTVHLPQNAQKNEPKSITIHSFTKITKNTGLEFIAKSSKLFRKHIEFQAKQIETEINLSRETKRAKEHWQNLKEAFHAKLSEINMAKQKKH